MCPLLLADLLLPLIVLLLWITALNLAQSGLEHILLLLQKLVAFSDEPVARLTDGLVCWHCDASKLWFVDVNASRSAIEFQLGAAIRYTVRVRPDIE